MKYTIVDPSTLERGATVRVVARSLEFDLEHLDEFPSAVVREVDEWPDGGVRVVVTFESGLEGEMEAELYTWLLVEEGEDVVEVSTEARRPRTTRILIVEVPSTDAEDAIVAAIVAAEVPHRVLTSMIVGNPESF